MILHDDIRQIDDAILREKSVPVNLDDQQEIESLFSEMREVLDISATRYEFTWAKGISAVQLGRLKQACLIWTPQLDWLSFINPKITKESEEKNYGWEGCLSFFDKRGLVLRPDWIEVTFYDQGKEQTTRKFEGNDARILSHEIDHMHGVLYIDRIENEDFILDVEEYDKLKAEDKLPTMQ
ncbi:MAG: peptide deformylase [Pseudomonadota bacterium]